MKITTRVTVEVVETDEDFPDIPQSQQRKVTHVEVTSSDDGAPPINGVAYIAGIAVGRTMKDLEEERALHPRKDDLALAES